MIKAWAVTYPMPNGRREAISCCISYTYRGAIELYEDFNREGVCHITWRAARERYGHKVERVEIKVIE